MKAVIMAGGEGTRLRPLTCSIPKPLVPICNKPTMEHIINLLKNYNITDIAVTLYYLPNSIIDYFGDGEQFGVNLRYYIEETPLGTGGSVLNAQDFLTETFIVISGDALTTVNLDKALKYHKDRNSKATIILKRESVPLEYGIVITDSNGKVVRFLEKPSWGEVFSDTVNTGIYIFEPEALNYYKRGDNFDFSKDLFPKLLKDNIQLYGYITNEYWCDIGDLNSYMQTNFDALDGKINILPFNDEIHPGIWIGNNTVIPDSVKINPPCFIGNNCRIENGVIIDSYSVIGDNCLISENSSVKRSIIWNNDSVGKRSELRGTIVCSNSLIKNSISLFEGSVIGNNCTILENTIIKPDVKIWPHKHIKENSIVNKNLIWGTKTSRAIFGNRGINGEITSDITPEFASLLGSAFAAITGRKSTIIVSSDNMNSSILIRESIISGIQSAGGKVINIENALLPVNRYAVRFYKALGGVHISTDMNDNNKLIIQFLNASGGEIDRKTEKKLEHLFARQDFERCNSRDLWSVSRVQNFYTLYMQNNLNSIKNTDIIKSGSPRILLASMDNTALDLAEKYLELMGCRVTCEYGYKNSNGLEKYLFEFSKSVSSCDFLFGAVIGHEGEHIILVDNKGKIIDRDNYTILSSLIALNKGNSKIILPCTATMVIDDLAKNFNAAVKRSKSSISSIVNELLQLDAFDTELPLQYVLNFDGILALGKIVEFLMENSISLSDFINKLPKFFMKKADIMCSFEERGRVIREFIENNRNKKLELDDGIRITTNTGWALILPDNERPVFNIYSEGFSQEYADELAASVKDTIYHIVNKK